MNESEAPQHDVVILGSHLATALLATILSRNGVQVALVRTGLDRELPSGETTVPYTAELFWLLGAKFGVPRIAALGRFDELPPAIAAASAAKRSLGFLYHQPGQGQQPAQALQFEVPSEHAEWHLARPEVDAYAEELATASGVTILSAEPQPGGVRVRPDGVTVSLRDGRRVAARYLVDGSGDPALLPEGVAGPKASTLHQARVLTARLTGVVPAEYHPPAGRYDPSATPWSAGTLTHVFPGGWLQVAALGNAAEAGSLRCGVTLSLDPDAYPRIVSDPAAEFHLRISAFPDIARSFASAVAERGWRRYQNWPAIAPVSCGARWFLFDRAAGRQDLVLSRDLTTSLELVHAAAAGLLGLAASGDWAGDGMAAAAAAQRRLLEFQDRLMHAARIASGDFALWNAYLRVWLLWTILCALSVKRAWMDGDTASGPDRWAPTERFSSAPYWYAVPSGLPELVDSSLADIEAVGSSCAGSPVTTADAAAAIFARLRREPFVPPLYDFGDPDARYYVFGPERRKQMAEWVEQDAPPDFRRLLTEENVTGVASRAS